jgi:hypothetical protein
VTEDSKPVTGYLAHPFEKLVVFYEGICQVANTRSHPLAASRPDPSLPPPTGKPTAGSWWPSTKRRVHVSPNAGTRGVLGDGKPPRFCLEDRWRAWANPTRGPACRLFPSLVQVLPVVGPPSCARLVVCRQDEQHTTDDPRPFPAQADRARGRRKEARQHTASCSREELLQVDAVTALKDVASKHPARWACLPSKSKQTVRVPLLPLRRAELGQTEQGTSRSPAWGQGKEPAALRDADQLEERYASCCPCGF